MKHHPLNHSCKFSYLHKPILLAFACSMPVLVIAEEQASIELETLEVISSPIIEENHIDDFSSTSSVITEDQLNDQNAVDLASALRRTPGVQISRFNPVGAFGGAEGGSVQIRGMGMSRPGSEIKTYVDGVPFYMATWGHPLLDLLPVNGMESITVYKSPQPQINGNNFSSINLTTKRGTKEGLSGNFKVSGGFWGTVVENADISGKYDDFEFTLAQGYARSDGHRDNAGGELRNVMGHASWQFHDNWSIGTNFIYTNNSAKDPGDSRIPASTIAPEYKTEAGLVSVDLSHEYENFRGSLKFYTTMGEGNLLDQTALDDDTLSSFQTAGLSWKEELFLWEGGNIILGVDSDWLWGDVQNNRVFFSNEINTPTFRITSPYVAVSQTIELSENWSLTPSAGVRYYNHSEFSSKLAPHAGLSLVSDEVTIFANISRGINYPGLEVATLGSAIPALGNTWKRLSPEVVDHIEVGFKLKPFDSTELDVSFFNDRVKNRYIFAFPPAVSRPTFLNFGTYDMRGIEIALKQDITKDWSFFGSLTLLDPSIENLPYVAKRAVSAGINGKIMDVKLSFDAQYQTKMLTLNRGRSGGATNTESVSSFVVVNAKASYPIPFLGEKGEVFLAVENLLDRKYSYRSGYPMPGVWGQLGLSASF